MSCGCMQAYTWAGGCMQAYTWAVVVCSYLREMTINFKVGTVNLSKQKKNAGSITHLIL